MILYSYYFNLPLFSKLNLPIEVDYNLKNSDEVIAFGDANGNSVDDDDNPFNWSPVDILQNTRSMFNIKKKIHEMAEANIKAQQKRDKLHYDRKHLDPNVMHPLISLM